MKKLRNAMLVKDSCVLVGIDPDLERLPADYMRDKSTEEKLTAFSKEIIDAVYDLVPAVKFQIAHFEKYGLSGMSAYSKSVHYAKEKGLFVIGDIKRGDIGSTAKAYAMAHLGSGSDFEVDAVTVNPYLGTDCLTEFISLAKENNKGVFVLVKTSNPSSGELQDKLTDGHKIYEKVIELISDEDDDVVGAVAGATYPGELENIREGLNGKMLLIPGYGAQGAKADDIEVALRHGQNAIVNSSREIIFAYEKYGLGIAASARKAVIAMKEDLYRWR